MLNLGMMYGTGEGVPVDKVQAYKWFLLAIPRDDTTQGVIRSNATHNRDNLAQRMTHAQIVQAQALARAWHRS